MAASLIALLLLRCKRCVPVAPSAPLHRSSHDGVAHYFASLALQTPCASDAVGMGLNLNIRRVIFHRLQKYGGRGEGPQPVPAPQVSPPLDLPRSG